MLVERGLREKGGEGSAEDLNKGFTQGGKGPSEGIFELWAARAISWCGPLVRSCSGC